ncbi:MAG: zinc-binding alcohol dehydrogenase [Myxococcota bacterium]
MQARALWVVGPGRGELRTEVLDPPAPDEVLVRTLYTAVSRGTESLVFHGHVPPGEYARMRAPHQAGDFPAPVKYGYCNVGRVERGPDSWVDRAVFCLYPHQTRYVVPTGAVVPIPSAVPPARAVLAANMETAINGVWDAAIRIGERIVVIGAGVVGSLVAYLARRVVGCEVQLVDIDERKRSIADAFGVSFALPDQAWSDVDCVFEASGSPEGLVQGLERAGPEARVVVLSWFGDQVVPLPLGQAFHAWRLRILSSQVGSLPPEQRSRWNYQRRLALALRLLEDDALDALVTAQTPFEGLPETMPQIADPATFVLCHRIVYG